MKWDIRFALLSPLLGSMFAVFVMFLNKGFLGAIDWYFVSSLLVCVASLTFLRSKRKWLRFLACLLVLLSLIHLASFRRNALVLLPFLLYGGVRVWFSSLHWMKGVLLALIFSAGVALATSLLGNYLTQKKVHSVSVMMVSDLRVAALLRGEEKQEANWLARYTTLRSPARTAFLLRADAQNDTPCPEKFDAMGRVPLNEEEWKALRSHYAKAWVEYPFSMLSARFIQATQFYCGSGTLRPVKTWVDEHFPAVQKYPDRWGIPLPDYESSQSGKLNIPWALGLLVTLIYGWHGVRYHRLGEMRWEFCSLFALLAYAYELSFMVVTPAPFWRYHLPALLLVFFFISMACVDIFLWRRKGNEG